jgi:hypothetical protein
LIFVIEHHAVDAAEDVLQMKVEVGIRFQPPLKVRSKFSFPFTLPSDVPNNWAAIGEVNSIPSS